MKEYDIYWKSVCYKIFIKLDIFYDEIDENDDIIINVVWNRIYI